MISLLERPVLVLNRYWQPIHTCSVRRSVRLLCNGHAEIVQVEGEEIYQSHDLESWIAYSSTGGDQERIRGSRVFLRVPRVLVLTFYTKVPRMEVRFSRRNVLLRDSFTCQYCGKKFPEDQLNLDHVIPRDKGGQTTWQNIVTSCIRCNTRKANKLPGQANMWPKEPPPEAPRWKPLFGLIEEGKFDECWRRFLGPMEQDRLLSA